MGNIKPEPPLTQVIKEGGGHFCKNCGSTSSRIGFLGLFGERLCDNKKCINSMPNIKRRQMISVIISLLIVIMLGAIMFAYFDSVLEENRQEQIRLFFEQIEKDSRNK